MRVLVGFEESQTVALAFRRLGHEAFSCDIEPCSGGNPEWHIQDDVFNHLHDGWDLGIFHPVCTYLTIAAEWAYKDVPKINGRLKTILPGTLVGEERRIARERALEDVRKLMKVSYPYAIENPVGVISTRIRKPDQKIQPWMFGHDASKGTCLWLSGLPALLHTNIIPPRGWKLADEKTEGSKVVDGYLFEPTNAFLNRPVWENQTPTGQNKLGPSKDRAKLRSKTYEGIAEAMAHQWSKFLLERNQSV